MPPEWHLLWRPLSVTRPLAAKTSKPCGERGLQKLVFIEKSFAGYNGHHYNASQTLKGPPQLGLLEMSWPTQRMTQQREHITPHQLFGWPCCCSLGAPSGSDGLQSFPGPGNRKLGCHLGLFRIGLFGWPGCCSLGAPFGSDGLQTFPGPGNRKWGFAIWVYLGLDSSAGLAVVPLGLLLDPMDCRAFRGLGIGSGVSPFGFIWDWTLRLAWIRWTAELSGAWESEVGFRHLGLFRIGLVGFGVCINCIYAYTV